MRFTTYRQEPKLIKSIAWSKGEKRAEVSLWDTIRGFRVDYAVGETAVEGEAIIDYNTATYLFELKVREMEGQ